MLAITAFCIPRARYFCGVCASVTAVAMIGLLVTLWAGQRDETQIVVLGLWMAAAVEFLTEPVMAHFLQGRRLVPVNIEHSKERLGALELIMLGETALSVTITYRELKEKSVIEDEGSYYWVLGLSFLLIFMFTLLFFHMQPAPSEHAFRRSRIHGGLLLLAHKVLGLALLTVGVSVKLVVEAVVLREELSPFGSRLMGLSVSAAILNLLFMRYLHYGGKSEICMGVHVMRYYDDPKVDRLAQIWWWTVGVAWLIPLAGVLTGIFAERPLLSTAFHAGLLLVLCVVESFYTHVIDDMLQQNAAAASDEGQSKEQQEGLLGAPQSAAAVSQSYQQGTT
jgi:hypothetical protein